VVERHGKDMGTVFDDVGAAAKKFWDWLDGAAHNAMTELQGYWTIVWGTISGVVGVAIDVMSGDWKKAKTDLVDIWKSIEVGVLEIVNGLVDQIIHVFHLMAGPLATALNAVVPPVFKGIVDIGIELFTYLVLKVEQSFGQMLGKVSAAYKAFALGVTPILSLVPGGSLLADKLRTDAFRNRGALSDKEIAAQAQAAGQGAATAVGGLLGPAPIPTFTFDEKKVTAVVDAAWEKTEKAISATLTTGASDVGKKAWDTFWETLHKHGITLPTVPGAGPIPPPPAGTGYGAGTAQTGAASAKDAVSAAQTAFALLLDSGKATWASGMKDIAGIAAAEHAAKVPEGQIALHVLQDTKELVGNLLQTAQKHFDFDAHVAHPSRKKLEQDEAAVLAILAKTPGIRPVDLGLARQGMDATIAGLFNQAASGQMPAVPAPAYGTYGGLATGYGQTTVSFGGPARDGTAQIIARLEAMLAYWRGRAMRDELLLRAGQQTAESSGQTAMNTARLESVLSHWTTPSPPGPSAAGRTRASGAFAPVHRA
jgi:hypothetical protein